MQAYIIFTKKEHYRFLIVTHRFRSQHQSLAGREHMDAVDYYCIATGYKMPDKFAKSGYNAEKSAL